MKSKMTFVLAASILTLTVTALPHVAAAGTNPPPPPPTKIEVSRPTGGKPVKYMQVELAVDILLLALLP